MRDAFQRIAQAVRVVIHRVYRPGVAGVLVLDVLDPVDGRVAQVDVAAGHVNLRAQGAGAVGELAGAHSREQIEVLGDGAIAEGRIAARFGQRAAVLTHLLRIQVAHIGLAVFHQLERAAVEHLEVVRRMPQLCPLEAQPAHVVLDSLDVFLVFFRGIGVVET